MTQPEHSTIDWATKVIVDRLFPEDDDNVFNEVSSITSKDLLTGNQSLSSASSRKHETKKYQQNLKI